MKHNGFTLLELLGTIAVISMLSLAAVPTIYHQYHYMQVSHAVNNAREIAGGIEHIRALGVIQNSYTGSLRGFIGNNGNSVSSYMPVLDAERFVLGVDQRDLYTVRVTEYSVLVSFSQAGTEFRGFTFPSSISVETSQPVNGVQEYTTTWTVNPPADNALQAHYRVAHYINNGS